MIFLSAAGRFVGAAVQLLLAALFLFVGGMKTLAPMKMLAPHHARVARLPELVARLVGVSDLLCAATMCLGLVVARFAWWAGAAAWLLVVNQMIAVVFHVLRGDIGASGPQNLVLVLALILIATLRCASPAGAG